MTQLPLVNRKKNYNLKMNYNIIDYAHILHIYIYLSHYYYYYCSAFSLSIMEIIFVFH